MKIYLPLYITILIFLAISCTLQGDSVQKRELKRDYYIYPHTVIPSLYSIEREAGLFFEDELFTDIYSKNRWLNRLRAFYKAYYNNFRQVTFYKNSPEDFDVIFRLKNGDIFYFADGVVVPPGKLESRGVYLPFFYRYSRESGWRSSNFHYGPFCYDLFFSLYGKSRGEIEKNLIYLNIFGSKVRFNRENGAAERLRRAAERVERLAESSDEVKRWIDSIGTVSTYSPRRVANEPKVSLHSFAIAIDIIPRNNRKQIYWYWTSRFNNEWWETPESERVTIPDPVVTIFEEEGFVWGGKWFKFDSMHFEYRPELLEQMFQ